MTENNTLSLLLHSFPSTTLPLCLITVFIDNTPLNTKVRGGIPSFASVQAATPTDLWIRARTKSHQKIALQGTVNNAGWRRAPTALKVFHICIFCSPIGDFGDPVGRYGEGREWGNIVISVQSVPERPSRVADTVIGDPALSYVHITPFEKEGVG